MLSLMTLINSGEYYFTEYIECVIQSFNSIQSRQVKR